MDDLIKRQDAVNELSYCQTYLFDSRDHDKKISLEDAEYTIERLPSAQKKGHWIDEGTNYLCSECHRGCWVNSNYCPWCGADMRGEEDG